MNFYTSNLAILFPLGCCLYIAMRLGDGRVDSRSGGPVRALIYLTITLLIGFSLAGILFRAGPISLIWLIGFIFLSAIVWLRSRKLNRAVLFQSITMLDGNLAQQRMAADFAQFNRGMVGKRSRLLQILLANGLSPSTAMERTKIASNFADQFSCRVLSKYGRKAEHLTQAVLQTQRIQVEVERLLGRLLPLTWLALGVVVIHAFLVFLAPTFLKIFDEFGMRLPASMLRVIELSSEFTFSSFQYVVYWALLLIFSSLLVTMVCWIFPRLTQYPPMRWFVAPYFRSLGLTALAVASRREAEFASACRAARDLMPIPFMAERLEDVAELISQGYRPEAALLATGMLGKRESDVVARSIPSGSFAWALDQLATAATERMLRLYSIAVQLAIVSAVLTAAYFFGMLAIAVFESLAELILQSQ
jgi:type II secretory pathway component PulF